MAVDLKYKILFVLILSTFVEFSMAEENEFHSMSDMLGSISLEKKQVEKIVERLEKSGRLSKEDGEKVRRQIASVDDTDIEQLKQAAIAELVRKGN